MHHRRFTMVRPILVVAMLQMSLALLLPTAASAAQSDGGFVDANSYESPQFGYRVTWSDPWAARDRDAISNPGGFDTLTLRADGSTLRMSGRSDDYSALTFLQDNVAIQIASGGEVINQDTTGDSPMTELLVGRDRMRIDVVPVPTANAIVLVSLRAPEASFDAALTSAQESVQLNESPIYDGSAVPQLPTEPAATEVPSTETPSVEPTQTISVPTQAVEPTVAPVLPTEPAGPTATPEMTQSNIDGSTYTSPMFGYSVSWNADVWSVPDEAEYTEPDLDSLRLTSDTGPISVIGWVAYNGSAATCLLGEIDYYNDPEFGISDWQVAVDGDGNELSGSSEGSAWGVFTNLYTDPDDPDAEPVEFVDYLECRSLGDGESVVIFHAYSERETYNEHINSVLAVVDSLEISDQPTASPPPATAAAETPTPGMQTQTPGATVTTNASTPTSGTETPVANRPEGTVIIGESYPYRFTVPAGWEVESSDLGTDIETTTVINGTSIVSIEARSMSAPSLAQCVKTVSDEQETQPGYSDLALARTASGDAFQGEDDVIAFANFTFTGPDGETWSHFVECRSIVEGQSVLIVTQDVPQELFGSERRARREIQNSIEVGE